MAESPLKEEDLAELKVKLSELDDADKLIEQSKRAGIDVAVQTERSRDLRDRLMKLRQAFWPGR